MIQRELRNHVRYMQHISIFGEPCTYLPPIDYYLMKHKLPEIDINRLKAVYYRLIGHALIINNKVYHWTTWDNFKNIVKNNNFFGNKNLKDHKIHFSKNALSYLDIMYGDGNIICFCPYYVDLIVAKVNAIGFKQNLIRLTIDLHYLDKNIAKYTYNQFFKIFDLCAPPLFYELILSTFFSVTFVKNSRSPSLRITFKFDNNIYQTIITAKEAIYYGNLYTINQFCLDKLFNLIDRAVPMYVNNDTSFSALFFNYLSHVSEIESQKILISLCQHMTIFSEYNFNCALKLTTGLISEIYDVSNNKLINIEKINVFELKNIYISLSTLPIFAYPLMPKIKIKTVKEKELIGSKLSVTKINNDFSTIPNSLFNETSYIETRNACKDHSSSIENSFNKARL